MRNTMKWLKTSSIAIVATGMLTACLQTTNGFLDKKEATLDELNVVLPSKAPAARGLEFENAEIRSRGNYVREIVSLNFGLLMHDRYYNGGFLKPTAENVVESLKETYDSASNIGSATADMGPMGDLFFVPFELEGGYKCIYVRGIAGSFIRLQGGHGNKGKISGHFCDAYNQSHFKETIVAWVKGVRLR